MLFIASTLTATVHPRLLLVGLLLSVLPAMLLCFERTLDIDKPVEFFKLGPSAVLAFEPAVGSESLNQFCSIRQSKLTTYITIPFYYSHKLAMEGEPFVQVINMHNLSFILYREDQNSDVKAQIASTVPDEKAKPLTITHLTKDIINSKLLFYIDMANMHQKSDMPLYFMSSPDTIQKVVLNEQAEAINVGSLKLPQRVIARRFLVYHGSIYILEFNKVIRVQPEANDFSKYKIDHFNLSREYSDMAIANQTFLFVRGYSSLISSPTFNPEDTGAIEIRTGFHHGKFYYAGFDHYVLSLTTNESSDREFYYIYREKGSISTDPKSVKIGKLSGNATGPHFRRMVQFEEAMYFIFGKSIQVEYFNSNMPPVVMDKAIPGRVYGVVGNHNRTIDSVHPLTGIHLTVKRRIRFRKLYINALHSELVCKKMPNLGIGQTKQLRARILTRKNGMDIKLNFKGGIKEEKPVEVGPTHHTTKPHKNIDDPVTVKNKTKKPVKIIDEPAHRQNPIDKPVHHTDPVTPKKNVDNGNTKPQNEKTPWEKYFYYLTIFCLALLLFVLCLLRSILRGEVKNMQVAHDMVGEALANQKPSSDPNDSQATSNPTAEIELSGTLNQSNDTADREELPDMTL